MRRWLAVILFFILILVITYFVFPGRTDITVENQIPVNEKVFGKFFSDANTWKKILPDKYITTSTNNLPQFSVQSTQYIITKQKLSSADISINTPNSSAKSELFFLPSNNPNQVQLKWEAQFPYTINPIKRISNYFTGRAVTSQMQNLVQRLKSFYSKNENIYGFDIKRSLVADSNLISTYISSKNYPTTNEIYELVNTLSKYAEEKNAVVTNYPMLNIFRTDSNIFITKVAIPVNKRLPNNGRIEYKWMLGGGNILITTVTGGPQKIQKAFQALDTYVSDNNLVAPAIPFQSLVADRTKIQDTAKWVTVLYYPVM